MKALVALCLVCLVAAEVSDDQVWSEYRHTFKKTYKNALDAISAKLFMRNQVRDVKNHNRAYAKGDETYTMGLNEFSDTNLTETRNMLCRTIVQPTPRFLQSLFRDPFSYPKGPPMMDWTTFMSPVVHQGLCGGCWAFATVAQLESLYKREFLLTSYTLSTQYLLDCCRDPPNNGCSGGWPRVAMEFIANTGIPKSNYYRFAGAQGDCKLPLPPFVTPQIDAIAVQHNLNGREDLLKNIFAKEGPVVIVMWSSPAFLKYKSGIFSDTVENCPIGCTNVNHAMLLVGYGVDIFTGIPYWLLRNSWGSTWGEGGYVKMLRDGTNNCNVACYAMYLQV